MPHLPTPVPVMTSGPTAMLPTPVSVTSIAVGHAGRGQLSVESLAMCALGLVDLRCVSPAACVPQPAQDSI